MMAARRASNACRRLVIFDFDHTLIDVDSDSVFPQLTGCNDVSSDYSGGSWLGHINGILESLYKRHNMTKDDFSRALGTLPYIAGIPELIKRLGGQPDHRLMVMSDANKFFIETSLEANKLRQYFTAVMSNHAEFDDQGRLRLSEVEEQARRAKAGTCPTKECPKNLCKGSEIANLIKEYEQFGDPEIWYVGDGWNDWCASVQLPSNKHHVFARRGYTLHSIISRHLESKKSKRGDDDPTLKCDVSFWRDGHELAECMTKLDPKLNAN